MVDRWQLRLMVLPVTALLITTRYSGTGRFLSDLVSSHEKERTRASAESDAIELLGRDSLDHSEVLFPCAVEFAVTSMATIEPSDQAFGRQRLVVRQHHGLNKFCVIAPQPWQLYASPIFGGIALVGLHVLFARLPPHPLPSLSHMPMLSRAIRARHGRHLARRGSSLSCRCPHPSGLVLCPMRCVVCRVSSAWARPG